MIEKILNCCNNKEYFLIGQILDRTLTTFWLSNVWLQHKNGRACLMTDCYSHHWYVCIYIYIYICMYMCICIYTYIYILFSSVKLLFYFHADWKIQKLQKHCISHCLFQPNKIKFLMRSGLDLLKVWPCKSSFDTWFFQHILSKEFLF